MSDRHCKGSTDVQKSSERDTVWALLRQQKAQGWLCWQLKRYLYVVSAWSDTTGRSIKPWDMQMAHQWTEICSRGPRALLKHDHPLPSLSKHGCSWGAACSGANHNNITGHRHICRIACTAPACACCTTEETGRRHRRRSLGLSSHKVLLPSCM